MAVGRVAILICITGTGALAEPVAELPLHPGYYVNAQIDCGAADNSSLYLVRRDGISSAAATCTISLINQTGPTRYEVTDNCTELASGSELGEATVLYDIPDDRSYGYIDGETVVGMNRYCAQDDLPEPFRSNDISDLLQ